MYSLLLNWTPTPHSPRTKVGGDPEKGSLLALRGVQGIAWIEKERAADG